MIGTLGCNIPEAQCEAEADLQLYTYTAEAEWRGGGDSAVTTDQL